MRLWRLLLLLALEYNALILQGGDSVVDQPQLRV